jgi:pyrroloquinoline quinone (PQQ) biosynthesis protein C
MPPQYAAPNITPIYFQEEPLVEHSLLNRLDERIENKSLLDHPYFQAWKAGESTLEDLQVYAAQYYFFEANFPRYLSCLSSCGD